MSDNVRRCIQKANRRMTAKRRAISRLTLYEKAVDGEKEARSILMARFPTRKKSEKSE